MANTQFTFQSKTKTKLLATMGVGVLCLVLTFLGDDKYHTRFWTNFLHNSAFFTGISFIALFLLCAKMMMYSGWHTVFKRLWEAYSLFLIVGVALMGIVCIGIWGHFHHLYHWADEATRATDKIIKGKSSFLSKGWYSLATFGFVGVWAFFAVKMRGFSLRADGGDNNYEIHKASKSWAAGFLPIAGFTSAAVIWQWIMSIDPHWYSTMFAWYTTASWLVSCVATTILLIIYLKSQGYMSYVTVEHLHDLGKYLFAFSIFWTYLWFSQFMLIWYSNNGEETVYFQERMDHYPVLYWGNLIMNFFIPLVILIRNDVKRKVGSLAFMAGFILLGHWIDFFMMIKPSAAKLVREMDEHAGHAAAGGVHEAVGQATEHAVAGAEHTVAVVAHGAEHAAKSAQELADFGTAHAEAIHDSIPFMVGFSIPGLLELGTFLGFAAGFVYFVFTQLEKAPLLPENDPYLQESLNHHVM